MDINQRKKNVSTYSVSKKTKANETNFYKNTCDEIYEFISHHDARNDKYLQIQFSICYYNQILLTTIMLYIIMMLRIPTQIYKYSCYDLTSRNYINCYYSNLCSCEHNCTDICSEGQEQCAEKFDNISINNGFNYGCQFTTNQKIYVFLETNNKDKQIFKRSELDYCENKNYTPLYCLLMSFSGCFGGIMFGLLSDRFGKRIILSICNSSLVLIFIILVIFAFKEINPISERFGKMIIFPLISFFLFTVKSLSLTHYLETFPISNKLFSYNCLISSTLSFSCLINNLLLENVSEKKYVFMSFTVLLIINVLIYCFYTNENPRYYSEIQDFENFKRSLENMSVEIIASNSNEEKEILFHRDMEDLNSSRIIKNFGNDKKPYGNDSIANIKNLDLDLSFVKNNKNKKYTDNLYCKEDPSKEDSSKNQENNKNTTSLYFKEVQSKEDTNKTNLKKAISITRIYYNFYKESNLKYIVIIFAWFTISYIYYGLYFGYNIKINNNNLDDKISFAHVITFPFLDLFFLFLVGISISNYIVHPNTIIKICFVLITIISFLTNWKNLSYDNLQVTLFGTNSAKKDQNNNIISVGFQQCFAIIIFSIFDLITLTKVPTLYRSFFFGICKSASLVSLIPAFLSNIFLDYNYLTIGIMSLISLSIFMVIDLNNKEIKFYEKRDIIKTQKEKEKVKKESENSKKQYKRGSSTKIF